ncbi:MAG TPA: hypothetical protein EYP25_12605, partial [Anaerolineae bacterium]|nr:hypothetical protein [Anaerolineae bacterium]
TTFASIFEELSKGFMTLSGAIGTHHILTYVLTHYGTEEQKQRFLPDLASGRKRGGLALTEPSGGTDMANLQTTATKNGEEYTINGTKMFITNGRYGDMFCLLARTDPDMEPRHKGISCFVVEKGGDGFTVGRDLDKLGYPVPPFDFRVPGVTSISADAHRRPPCRHQPPRHHRRAQRGPAPRQRGPDSSRLVVSCAAGSAHPPPPSGPHAGLADRQRQGSRGPAAQPHAPGTGGSGPRHDGRHAPTENHVPDERGQLAVRPAHGLALRHAHPLLRHRPPGSAS